MSGTQTYAEHLAQLRASFEANFYRTTAPAETKRSAGLDQQTGVIVGLRPVVHDLIQLANAAADLPRGVWSSYNTDNLHLTLCDNVDRDNVRPTAEMTTRFHNLQTIVGVPREQQYKPGRLTNARLGISSDTIVVCGVPDENVFALRTLLATLAAPSGLKPGWSSGHITLARLKKPLDPSTAAETARWLRSTHVPDEIPLTGVIAGLFVVQDDKFGFTQATPEVSLER